MDQFFKIYQVDEAEARKISASPDELHKHDFEEMIIGIQGKMEHFIDFKTITIDAPFVSFVTKGKMHRVITLLKNGKCDFWVIRFKSEFIPATTFQLYSYYHDYANIKMQSGNCFNRFITLCEMMSIEMQQTIPDLAVIRHLLSALLTMIESERKKVTSTDETIQKTQNITFKNFLKILEENFHRPEGVEFYAEKLFMSARNLNLICQNILHQTVTETIEIRKLIEAKNLLTSTDKSVSEIGFELGFNEKAYFTAVFKKKSGQTPTEFREEMRKLIS
jgi:AraC family transcriptional regulator, transcriptional activator of pobA